MGRSLSILRREYAAPPARAALELTLFGLRLALWIRETVRLQRFDGALFGLSHLPFQDFAALTFAAGTFWAWIFLRTGSLYPIVLMHWGLGLSLLRA